MTLNVIHQFQSFELLVVYICAALYKISNGTPASRGPSATAGLLVVSIIIIIAVVIAHIQCVNTTKMLNVLVIQLHSTALYEMFTVLQSAQLAEF